MHTIGHRTRLVGQFIRAVKFEQHVKCDEQQRWVAGRPRDVNRTTRLRDRAAYQWSVEVSVYVDAAHHRSGIARALYTELFRRLVRQGFHTAHAGIALPNPASVSFHESMGFVPIGVYLSVGFKRGAWHDVGWWRLPLAPCDRPPSPLRPVEGA